MDDQKKQTIKVPMWLSIIILLLTIIVIAAAIYLQFFRYSMVAQSIRLGNNTSTALLLSPEIAFSVSKFL